jgi:hypothetical protein
VLGRLASRAGFTFSAARVALGLPLASDKSGTAGAGREPNPRRSRGRALNQRRRLRAKQRSRSSNSLNNVGADHPGKIVRGPFRRDVRVLRELDLHQFVILQRILEILTQRIRNPLVANVDGDAQLVCLRPELSALLGRQRHRSLDAV